MTTADHQLLLEVQQYVTKIFLRLSPSFVYHSLEHTREVVKNCDTIAKQYSLSDEEYMALMIAAWFHDAGYAKGGGKNHEEESKKIAEDFLKQRNVDGNLIDMVNGCILATKMPQSPSNLIEQITCDGDLYHLGTDAFEENNKRLRQEINQLQDEKISKKEWRQINTEFLQRHRYFTDYCQQQLEKGKQKNLEKLLEKESKKDIKEAEETIINPELETKILDPGTVPPEENAKKEKEKAKDARSERGVVAMFRIMSENHVSLSQMADNKANIMISVNTIVITIMVSVLLGRLQYYPEYIVPTIILVGICLGAVIFSILATRPNVSQGVFTKEDIFDKKVNLLFFGNFYKMELPDYDWAMNELMKDKEYLYSSMIKDIYFLGLVLAKKYRYLRYSYNIFMFGLIISLIAFVVAALVAPSPATR